MRKWKREDHKIPTLDKELQAMKEKLRAGETVLPREGHWLVIQYQIDSPESMHIQLMQYNDIIWTEQAVTMYLGIHKHHHH